MKVDPLLLNFLMNKRVKDQFTTKNFLRIEIATN